jgi:DNA-directed RNA polymerase subunit M/transcription elongation factor TFIIS
MDFCEKCNNMLYINVEKTEDGKNQLKNYCKNCNFSKELSNTKSMSIIETIYEKSENINYKLFINPYIKYDPTLPRVNNIECNNKECTKEKDKMNEVIYIKYDNENMKYLYYCVYCEKFWKLD